MTDGESDYIKAMEYEEQGDYPHAAVCLQKSFDKGYQKAVCALRVNKHMNYCNENKNRIFTLIEMASSGNSSAEFSVGARYLQGINIAKDLEKGIYWLKKASEGENSDACYYLGKYIEKNPAPGFDSQALITKAADLGHPLAQNDLARKYLDGTLPKNPEMALKLYMDAGNNGYWIATRHAAEMFYNGTEIPRDMCKAFELYCKASDAGDPESCLMVAKMYETGVGTEKNIDEAVRLYALLAINYTKPGKNFCNEAAYRLGSIFENGLGVQIDMEDALYWYSRAADKGHMESKKAVKRLERRG